MKLMIVTSGTELFFKIKSKRNKPSLILFSVFDDYECELIMNFGTT